MSESSAFPSWIYKRDGRLVPFEPDKISQALFAATEALGRPDAFLARELTDGVLHFLVQEDGAVTPTTAQLTDLVVKVIRELGQPVLAQAFEARIRSKITGRPAASPEVVFTFTPMDSPATLIANCLRTYSLHAVFSRDLAAAQQDGLLTLTGLETPLQLAACVAGTPDSVATSATDACLFPALDVAADLAQVVCLDSPEHALAAEHSVVAGGAARTLVLLARDASRRTVVNLGCGLPPVWAAGGSAGPLFADQHRLVKPEDVTALTDAFLEQLITKSKASTCRVDWHLGERDFISAPGARYEARLLRLARWAVEVPFLTFTFDRPRRPISLGEGVDRKHPAVLLAVGLRLPRLLDLPGVHRQPSAFLHKMATLARLALSAAVQKRDYLRRQSKATVGTPALGRGFLLERARLVVVPVGLEAVVRQLTGCGLGEGKPGLDLARQMIEHLREVLEADGRRANLDSCIDGITTLQGDPVRTFALEGDWETLPAAQSEVALPLVAGLTPWAPGTPARNQLRAAGILHAAAGGGTAALFLPDDAWQQPEIVADLLHFAWRQTDIVRLRLVRSSRQQQKVLGIEC